MKFSPCGVLAQEAMNELKKYLMKPELLLSMT